MSRPKFWFDAELTKQANAIDLSPRQWYLLAADIGLGHLFKSDGEYGLDRLTAEQHTHLHERAAMRLVRNGRPFVHYVDAVEASILADPVGRSDSTIHKLPESAAMGLRKAQVAIAWLRTQIDGLENEWRLIAPRVGLILPVETFDGEDDAEVDVESEREELDPIPCPVDTIRLRDSFSETRGDTVRVGSQSLPDILARISLSDEQWELLGARFGPSATLGTDEIAEDFDMSRQDAITVLTSIQDRLVSEIGTLAGMATSLETHIATTWPADDIVTVRTYGARLVRAFKMDGITADQESVSKFFNVFRAVEKVDPVFGLNHPHIKERLTLVQLPPKPMRAR